jgi:thiamine kinase-like enzyme
VEVAERVAAMMAQIHGLRMTAQGVGPADALFTPGAEHWRAYAERIERSDLEWRWEFRRLLPVLGELEAYVASAHGDGTPLLLAHRDSDPKNHMRTPSGDLVLVDWDAAGPVNPRHDLANHALVWAGVHLGEPDRKTVHAYVTAYRRAGGEGEAFRSSDLAELVSARLRWFDFNVRRILGEHTRDDADREAGSRVIQRNFTQLPRFVASLDRWVRLLGEA